MNGIQTSVDEFPRCGGIIGLLESAIAQLQVSFAFLCVSGILEVRPNSAGPFGLPVDALS